jgi:hypothetical protein
MIVPKNSGGAMARRGIFVLFTLFLFAPAGQVAAVARSDSTAEIESLETISLKSIASWLKQSGRDGYLGADVADAAGIPRDRAEDVLDAKQRGFKSDNILRVAQVAADQKRDFLLFMVQRPDGQVYFYLATVKEGLKKAFVSNPGDKGVALLEAAQAQANFQQEILYWQARIAGG